MDLTKLSKEDLILVTAMLIQGTPMAEIELKFISQNMRSIVDNLHSLLCQDAHTEESICKYYTSTEYDKEPRSNWLLYAADLMKSFETDEDSLRSTLVYAFRVIGFTKTELATVAPGLEPLLLRLLKDYFNLPGPSR